MRLSQPSHNPVIGPGCVGSTVNLPQNDPGQDIKPKQVHLARDGSSSFVVDPSDVAPRKHTEYPMVTGSSVIAITYAGGVLIGCDTLGSYGSTKRYKSMQRLFKVNDTCMVGASGEISDFQEIQSYLSQLSDEDYMADDGISYSPQEIHSYLCRVMYNRRSKFDPLWNSLVVIGLQGGEPFCGMVSMIGVSYKEKYITTGFASHLALPVIREIHKPDMKEEEAIELMKSCLKVCYYRDKSTMNKFVVGKVSSGGATISEPFSVATEWSYEGYINPTKWAVGCW